MRMRSILTAIAVAAGLLGATAFAAQNDPVKVVSYNIAAGQGSGNDSKDYVGTKYLDEVVRLMKAEKADLIGMQEVDDNRFTSRFVKQDKYIAERLGMFYYWHQASAVGPFGKLNKHGNAVLSKHKILDKKCVEYKSKGKKSDGGASAETRALTWALVDIGGTKVNFISTHLGFPEYARVGQAKELVAFMKKLSGPVVLVGDFNTGRGSESYKVITAMLDDSYTIAKEKGAANTSGTDHGAKPPANCIDYVFLSRGDFVCEKGYAGDSKYAKASDHYPYFAVVRLAKGAKAAAPAAEGTGKAEAAGDAGKEGLKPSDEGSSGGRSLLDVQKSLFGK